MGHQESLLFCDSKSDMLRLCKLLNRAASDSSERGLEYAGLDIFEVARLKQTVKTVLSSPQAVTLSGGAVNVRLRQWMNFVVTLYREIPVLEYCFCRVHRPFSY